MPERMRDPSDPPDHYFSTDPAAASAPREIRVVLGSDEIYLHSDAGVFSGDHLDPGTSVLLRALPDPPQTGTLLDLGCGYGVIATWLGRRSPGARVVAVDVNPRALDLTRRNAERHGLANVLACRPEEVDRSTRFDAIYSNPPIRVGKAQLHGMLLDWLGRLTPGGAAFLVTHKHLGADSLQRWFPTVGYACERLTSVRGYRVLRVSAAPHVPELPARDGEHPTADEPPTG